MTLENTYCNPTVSVLIVNYNTECYLRECLHCLAEQQGISYEVIVVDNHSDDAKKITEYQNAHVKVVLSPVNLGFGRANNLAASHAKGEYLLILNPDVMLVTADTLENLVSTYSKNHYALLSPLVEEPEKSKSVQPRYSYPSQSNCRYTDFSTLHGDIAWVLGACMLLRRSDFLRIGGFDQDYFMYGEDTDICLRTRKYLGPIGIAPHIKIKHIGGASERNEPSLEKWLRKRRGAFLFYRKNFDSRDFYRICRQKKITAKASLLLNKLKSIIFGKTNRSKWMDNCIRAQATLLVIAEIENNDLH